MAINNTMLVIHVPSYIVCMCATISGPFPNTQRPCHSPNYTTFSDKCHTSRVFSVRNVSSSHKTTYSSQS